ncbi:MAG: NADPH-dependent FMN reductase [Solirubrobacterales bacterium]
MRILAISGSLRRGSYSSGLLRAARELAPAGVEIDTYGGLAGLPAYDEDLDAGAPPAPVAELRERIAGADALLIATPEYNGSVPGALKNALDWASRPHGLSALSAKPVGVIGSSPSPFGGAWAEESLRRVLTVAGALPLETEMTVGKVDTLFVDGELADPGTRSEIAALVAGLAGFAEAGRAAEAPAAA